MHAKQMSSIEDKSHPSVSWTRKIEEHFAATGERAHCLSWAHKRAEELYSIRRTYIDLPVIVLSSVTGFCSVGQGIIFEGQDKLSSILLGVISLFVGVLNTTGSYFGWAKRTEAHRISSIHYARLYRSIKVEMSLPRDERMTPTELLKFCKDQYERLAEISPMLPPEIVKDFKKKFYKYANTVTFPEEMNGLDPIDVFDPEYEAALRAGGETARRAEEAHKLKHPPLLLASSPSFESITNGFKKRKAAAPASDDGSEEEDSAPKLISNPMNVHNVMHRTVRMTPVVLPPSANESAGGVFAISVATPEASGPKAEPSASSTADHELAAKPPTAEV